MILFTHTRLKFVTPEGEPRRWKRPRARPRIRPVFRMKSVAKAVGVKRQALTEGELPDGDFAAVAQIDQVPVFAPHGSAEGQRLIKGDTLRFWTEHRGFAAPFFSVEKHHIKQSGRRQHSKELTAADVGGENDPPRLDVSKVQQVVEARIGLDLQGKSRRVT